MAYINQPPDLRAMQENIDNRLSKLELAQRFTAPVVTSNPTNPRTGDIWYNTTDVKLRALLTAVVDLVTTGTANIFTALQTFSQGISVANGATITTGNLTASVGNIAATAGSISAGTTVSAGTTIVAGTGITATTGNITATAGTISGTGLSITGGSTLTTSLNLNSFTTATTVGAAGAAAATPLPVGYVTIQISGTDYKIPYYNV
jgi:hypothetical protein